MADGDRISRNGGMNDGTYRIELTGDETWNGRPLHYMRRDELSYMWGTMEERCHPSAPGNTAAVLPGAGTVHHEVHVG